MEHVRRLDIIVNNAGYTWDNVIQKMTDEQLQAMLDVHHDGAVPDPARRLADAIAHACRRRRKPKPAARCSARSSTSPRSPALNGNAGPGELLVGQGRVVGLTHDALQGMGPLQGQRQLRRLRADRHAPDPADAKRGGDSQRSTAATSRSACQPRGAQVACPANPLGRGGTPEEAAGAVYLFCIPESNYISGQTIAVAGELPVAVGG